MSGKGQIKSLTSQEIRDIRLHLIVKARDMARVFKVGHAASNDELGLIFNESKDGIRKHLVRSYGDDYEKKLGK